jgi:hypothetical protein
VNTKSLHIPSFRDKNTEEVNKPWVMCIMLCKYLTLAAYLLCHINITIENKIWRKYKAYLRIQYGYAAARTILATLHFGKLNLMKLISPCFECVNLLKSKHPTLSWCNAAYGICIGSYFYSSIIYDFHCSRTHVILTCIRVQTLRGLLK